MQHVQGDGLALDLVEGQPRFLRSDVALFAKLEQRIAELKVGDGMDSGMDMGPLITAEHRDKVLAYIEDGIRSVEMPPEVWDLIDVAPDD